MANDPKNYRYGQHKAPPEGLAPIVNQKDEEKASPPRKNLSKEQQEKRKKLLAKMQEAVKEQDEQVEQQSLRDNQLPYDVEDKHPAEDFEEETSEISKYRMTLSAALETPEMKSIRFGVIGAGQCGGRLAEKFHSFGYPVCVVNTAEQDLAFLDIPDKNKLLLPYALGGAGKNLLVGQQAAQENFDKIKQVIENSLKNVDQILLTLGGGGGSGGGAIVPLLQAIMESDEIEGLPIVVIYTLPMADEGALAKSNAIKTLERIATMVNDEIVSSLIIVDNAKIQKQYPSVSIKDFWDLANFDIVNHFNMFNTVSKCATNYDALDPMDFANIVSVGGCLIYGKVEVPATNSDGEVELDENLLARALVRGISEGTLAEGFDVTQAINIGVIITGNDQVLSQIPAVNVNYAFNVLSEHVGEDCSIYRGMYADDMATNTITVYTIFSGLNLPAKRIQNLKEEASQALQKIESKKKAKLSFSDDREQKKQDPYEDMRQKNTSVGRMIQRRRRMR